MATKKPSTNPYKLDPKGLAFIRTLNQMGIRTVVVDEAHHLRNEWWKSLEILKSSLDNPVILALTATPPYDAEPLEWRRYTSFCGPIDIEVPVPSLVARKDLCPHQDYVEFSTLSEVEELSIQKIKKKIKSFIEGLFIDTQLIGLLVNHPVVVTPDAYERELFDNPEYFSAIGSFLKRAGQFGYAKSMMRKITGRSLRLVPAFDEQQAEILLSGVLFADQYFQSDENKDFYERFFQQTNTAGIIELRQVFLSDNAAVARIIRNSVSKLKSIERVTTLEYNNLKDDLSCVILTDFIRKEYLPQDETTVPELNRLGVIPIFEQLRRGFCNFSSEYVAVLTGTIIVIPDSLTKDFDVALQTVSGAKKVRLGFQAYPGDGRFKICHINDSSRQYAVAAMTKLFHDKQIRVLVGTKALLGEGWDAPVMNTLLLASFVGSFMLSNQMRGRAIRTLKSDPNKTANIWHFATLAPNATHVLNILEKTDDLGPELRLLQRRFETFVGVSVHNQTIESGLSRATYLTRGPYPVGQIVDIAERANYQASLSSRERSTMAARWFEVLESGTIQSLVHTTEPEVRLLPRSAIFLNTLKTFILAAAYNALAIFDVLPRLLAAGSRSTNPGGIIAMLMLVIGFGGLYLLYKCIKLSIFAIKHRTTKKSIERIADVVLQTLQASQLITTEPHLLRIVTTENNFGQISCGLTGGTTFESDLFLDTFEELLSPVQNPRYLLVDYKQTKFNRAIPPIITKVNYYPVPKTIATHKQNVEKFEQLWRRAIGDCHCVYTRNQAGRKLILRARRSSKIYIDAKEPKRHSVWS